MIRAHKLVAFLLSVPGIRLSQSISSPTTMSPNIEPNPPRWPSSVKVFRPTDDVNWIANEIRETEDGFDTEHKSYTTLHHFSDRRWALLFAPGTYKGLDFEVGYYVQVAGLGNKPKDVVFADCETGPFVPAVNQHLHAHGSCLDTFWRSAENFSTQASKGMKWAVSQAAPLRNVHVANDLYLHDGEAYASGGHLANSVVDGHTYFGGQQQFLSRNVNFGAGVSGGAWSLVFVGCTGQVPQPSKGSRSSASMTVNSHQRVRMEKPYVALNQDGLTYSLQIPMTSTDGNTPKDNLVRDFSNVRVVDPSDPDVTTSIQEALDEDKDVVFAPGIFMLTNRLQIKHNDQVLLGLGLATLVAPKDGAGCIHIPSGLEGVRIAGIMLEASEKAHSYDTPNRPFTALLEWGEKSVKDKGNPSNPGGLFDIFCRVGGADGNRDKVFADSMMRIHSSHIVGDNLWLWRADHSALAPGEEANCPQVSPIFWQNEEDEGIVGTGIEVSGSDVTIYGLAVEHANGHQTVWHGERGEVHFYQCELPYDVSESYGPAGYRGYLISQEVQEHSLYGPGVYSNFRNAKVSVAMAIEAPETDGIRIVNAFTTHLDNNGQINSVMNGRGNAATEQGKPTRIE